MHRAIVTAAAVVATLGLAGPAAARTVIATTANAGSTVSVTTGDTLEVKLPGHWNVAGDTAPELTLDTSTFEGQGARGHTTLTFSAAKQGSLRLSVKNAITGVKLSMQVAVAQ